MKSFTPIVLCAALSFSSLALLHAEDSAPAPSTSSAGDSASASKLDFGNFSSSAITNQAWKALQAKDYASVQGYTDKCISMFKGKAVEMQKSMSAPPETSDKAKVFANWALNDVGTCYYIQAKADEDQGKTKEAIEAYKFLADNLSYAECYDTKGWFWSPAGAAKERLAALQFDSIK